MIARPAARLHVIPAIGCKLALVLRRGPSRHVASLLWDRASDVVKKGQWLKGRIYEHRTDLSPDGRHMIYFAGNGQRWWTALSRAPFLRAICYHPVDHTWHGGGAFDADGGVFFNGFHGPDALPDRLRLAKPGALPPATDGVHMGGLFAARMALRGWHDAGGAGYQQTMEKPVPGGWTLRQTYALGARNRGLLSNAYTLIRQGQQVATDWEWAEPWKGGLQLARAGAIWHAPLTKDGLGEARLIHDFNAMAFEPLEAPYEGIRA
ncbi:hypothetical protein [Gymnodinialimonas sp. 57CJ19]|uniref:hypothetical protein n=1 Tax=Gymnodinialimonas sp. 57CJ19 TaxID=3138498 RepID=UPI00313436CC